MLRQAGDNREPMAEPVQQAPRCVDCGAPRQGPFCGQCGARAPVRPLTVRGLFVDLLAGVLDADRGVAYTFRQLLGSPGAAPRRYIEGATARLTRPFHYLVLCCAFAAGLAWLAYVLPSGVSTQVESHVHTAATSRGHLIGHYSATFSRWAWLVLLVISAALGRLVFRGNRLGHAEHLAFAAYTFAQLIVLAAVAFATTHLALAAGARLQFDEMDAAIVVACAWHLIAAIAFFRGSVPRRVAGAMLVLFGSLVLYLTLAGTLVAIAVAMGMIR